MKKFSQFIYGNEVVLPLSSINVGELFFSDYKDKIAVYRKTQTIDKVLVKIVNNYGELYNVKDINIQPEIHNYIILNN